MGDHLHSPLRHGTTLDEHELISTLVEGVPVSHLAAKPHSPRVAIRIAGRILFINPDHVLAIHARGNYVLLQLPSSSYQLRESISVLAKKLEGYGFIRIHRSMLVNASFVEEIRPLSTGDYRLRLQGGKEYLATRTYKKNLKSLADFWIGASTILPD